MWRDTSAYFEKKNSDVINQILRTRPLQSSRSSINAMLRNTEEMKAVMPLILGQGHSGGQDQSFANAVSNYWNSLSYRIPFPSHTWETGFMFDVEDSDPIRKEYIEKLAIQLKAFTKKVVDEKEVITYTLTDEQLADYVMGDKDGKRNVPVENMYRYGTPIDPAQFLLWQYSLNHGLVANTKELLKNSTKMEFYLVDETVAKKERESLQKIKNDAKRVYLETIAKPETVIDILAVLHKDIPFDTPEDEERIERESLLEQVALSTPQEFLDTVKSTNLTTLAKIERYIKIGIFKRLDNSAIVVDAENPSIIIGNTSTDQIAFFANKPNAGAVAEYAAKYKSKITN